MPGKDESLQSKTSQIVFAVSLYWVVSISMVFINKYLLSSPDLEVILKNSAKKA